MDMKKFLEEKSNEFSIVGKIIGVLNLIEQHVVIAINIFFIDYKKPQREQDYLLNDVLWDSKIFETFEQKRQFLLKIIKRIARIAKEKDIQFSEEKYLTVCKRIKKVQEWRNEMVHHWLTYDAKGIAGYHKRKSEKEWLNNHKQGKKGSMKRVEIDLVKILTDALEIYDDSEILLSDLQKQIREVLGYL